MPEPRPFRFGVLTGGAPSRAEWVGQARRAEELGYSTLLLSDHVGTALAPIAALATAAAATTTLRIGSQVFGNDFRHPVLLAKEAATLDLLSEGRLELGLGTGYSKADYDQTGIPLEPPGVRVSRFAEAVRIIKGAQSEEPFSFSGTYYTVRDLALRPKPAQRPHPPIVIGGAGRRILSLAAREADIVSINVRTTAEGQFDQTSFSPEAVAQAVEWVRRAAGARFGDRELSVLVPFVQVTNGGRRHAAEQLLQRRRLVGQMTADQLLETPKTLLGSVDDICEALTAHRQRLGLSYPVIFAQHMEAFAPVVARLAGR